MYIHESLFCASEDLRHYFSFQLRGSRAELESSKSETAAVNVRISSLESQLQQARAALASRDSEIQQQKVRITESLSLPRPTVCDIL